MIIQHTYLRTHRKDAQLTQADLAFILELPDYSNISRWEQGQRRPSIEMLLVYHLLFEIPIDFLFERQKMEMFGTICERIRQRIDELKNTPLPTEKRDARISFLETALKRLTA